MLRVFLVKYCWTDALREIGMVNGPEGNQNGK